MCEADQYLAERLHARVPQRGEIAGAGGVGPQSQAIVVAGDPGRARDGNVAYESKMSAHEPCEGGAASIEVDASTVAGRRIAMHVGVVQRQFGAELLFYLRRCLGVRTNPSS